MSVVWLALLACSSRAPTSGEPVTIEVFAASSLVDVLPKVAEAWHQETGHSAKLNIDASPRLAEQIENGAPVDVFIPADEEWMTYVADRNLLRRDAHPVELLSNRLVAIVPAGSSFVPSDASELADPRIEHLALAGETVPTGHYARDALKSQGVWNDVSGRIVGGDTSRAALATVVNGEAEAGVVYSTDARGQEGVKVAFTFPKDSHPPIVYLAAVTAASKHPEEASAFVAFCTSGGRPIFEADGFTVLGPSPRIGD